MMLSDITPQTLSPYDKIADEHRRRSHHPGYGKNHVKALQCPDSLKNREYPYYPEKAGVDDGLRRRYGGIAKPSHCRGGYLVKAAYWLKNKNEHYSYAGHFNLALGRCEKSRCVVSEHGQRDGKGSADDE